MRHEHERMKAAARRSPCAQQPANAVQVQRGAPAETGLLASTKCATKNGAGKNLAGPPVAVHARSDDRAAWPVLPHVMRAAIAHGVGAGIVARVDIGRPFLLPIDRHAPQRPAALRGHVRDGRLRSRRDPQLRQRRLRLRHRTGKQEPGKSSPNCDRHNPLHLKSTHA